MTSLSTAIALARDALATKPAGLLTDFDGTLSPIVARPDQARPADGVADALAALSRNLAVVAVITGRAATDARRLLGLDSILVAGNHGTEWLAAGDTAPTEPPGADGARAALRTLLALVPALPGVEVEDKGLSATVHVRGAADPAGAERAVRAALGQPPPAVELRGGRMSIEIRPTGLGDKGAAVRAIVERFSLRGVVVMGDDVTDLDMFDAVADLRASGAVRGAIVAVGGADQEVPAQVAAAADVSLGSPAEVTGLLLALAAGR